MSEKIEAALTPEQWATAQAHEGKDPRTLHYAAALALHGQPFGFTWRDVDLLEGQVQDLRRVAQPVGPMHSFWDDITYLEMLRDRIAALLPPREKP